MFILYLQKVYHRCDYIIAYICKKTIINSLFIISSIPCIFCFPDALVRGKHSAWMSTHHRAEARTHYTQKNGAPKPSSGRKGDRDSGGRSPRDFQFARILLLRALLQSPTAPAPSRREPFVSLPHKNNTTKEKSLVVFVFSPLRMQRRMSVLF